MTGNIWVVLPLLCLAVGAFTVYVVGQALRGPQTLLALVTALLFLIALAGLAPTLAPKGARATSAAELTAWGPLASGGASLVADPVGLVVLAVALGLGGLVATYSAGYLALDLRHDTYYPLLLLMMAGLSGMVLAADLFNLYLFCELMSVAAYALVAFRRHLDTAIEAGFKYLVMGSVGSVTMLLGISFVYRSLGSLALSQAAGPVAPWTRAGLACLTIGLGVKSAIVPLHTWLPDAHGRAPSSVSAMLSGIVIQSAFYALLKVTLGLGFPARDLGTLLIVLSFPGMTLGNSMALVQSNTKRLLAYSTIAQMGYVMVTIGIGLRYQIPGAIQAGLFLVLAHAAMKGLAFLCIGTSHFYCNTSTTEELRGTSARLPLVAVAFAIALAGLAGVPPLAGFASKWFLLTAGLKASDALAYAGIVIFLVNSIVSLGYYLPLIGVLFTSGAGQPSRVELSPWIGLPLAVLGAVVLLIGLYPQPWLIWTGTAGEYLLAMGR